MAKIALSWFVALFLSGCVATLPPTGFSEKDWPEPASYAEMQKAIKAHFEDTLIDPESARYKFVGYARGYGNHGIIQGGGIRWKGVIVYLSVNSKNRFGGYTGGQAYMALMTGNEVFKVVEGGAHPLIQRVEVLKAE